MHLFRSVNLVLNKLLKTSFKLNLFEMLVEWTLFFFLRRWLGLSIYKLFEIIYIQSIYIHYFFLVVSKIQTLNLAYIMQCPYQFS